MHGCSSGFSLLVNADIDSMGGVVEGGVGIDANQSLQQAAIEKAQAELRQGYNFLEERRRELDFLEKGGNPLDFKFGNVLSVSAQSTSDHHPEQFVRSEVKGNFALTASPYGDSVESSSRPGALPVCEPNCADNLMLFDGENKFLAGEKKTVQHSRIKIAPSRQSLQCNGNQNAKELGYSTSAGLPKKAYRRRYRSRPNCDGAWSSSTDIVPCHDGHGSSLPSRHGSRDVDNQRNRIISSNHNSKTKNTSDSLAFKNLSSDSQRDFELGGTVAVDLTSGMTKGGLPDFVSDDGASKSVQDNHSNQCLQLDAQGTPTQVTSQGCESAGGREHVVSTGFEIPPCINAKIEKKACPTQVNGFNSEKRDRKSLKNEALYSSAPFGVKGLDSESSCTRTSLSVDGNNDIEICTNLRNIGTNDDAKKQTSPCEGTKDMEGDKLINKENETKADVGCAFINDNGNSEQQRYLENGSILKTQEEPKKSGPGSQEKVNDPTTNGGMEPDGITVLEMERKPCNLPGDNSTTQNENACTCRHQVLADFSIREFPETLLSVNVSTVAPGQQVSSEVRPKLASKVEVDEDSILEEARIIEVKHKRIAELSISLSTKANSQKSHWDFVVEEMAWLANDFAQERLWKITAAAQLAHRVALTSQSRFQDQNWRWQQKEVAHTLAKAIMEFWHSVEERSKLGLQFCKKDTTLAICGYAVRFLKENGTHIPYGLAEALVTSDRISDLGILNCLWKDNLTKENLFYTVPSGAIDLYRKSVESHVMQFEKSGSSIQEVEICPYDVITGFGSQENTYEEDEGETNTYYLPGAFKGSRSLKFGQKKQKNLANAYGARSYKVGVDLAFAQCAENKLRIQQSVLMGKRPAGSINVSIPTKRVRTASRQKVPSPLSAGILGCVQVSNKTDASSDDTNSFQDDKGTLHFGSQIPSSLEIELAGEFEKQLPFGSEEVSKPKKKKKEKYLGSTYEQRLQLDSDFQNDQRDHSNKRSDSHQLESNGSIGLFGHHIMKKPKVMRQSLDNSFDNLTPIAGSIPSPVASQMSNMSNPNKFVKILSGRDHSRKTKALKMLAGQSGSGNSWSLFEDQALMVLVHDMGPNWELVSDAINSTLQFKCIFHKPIECKERHKILMDGTSGDGADSAEDSGSSQPYSSTLPGIPKGSARQLFQRLQGPMEEDVRQSHFKKIIMLGQTHHCRRDQNDKQDPKQIQQPHSSHMLALSQVCPNNLNGGPILTPLDLCDATASSPDVLSLAYQGPHNSGFAINQGPVALLLPCSGANLIQGSASMILDSNFSSPAGPPNASVSVLRDGKYGVPRTVSSSTDEQQRLQQYNQMLSSKNIQQSGIGALPGNDHGVGMLPGGNGIGIGGINRSIPVARPGFQGIASSSMLKSGSMFSPGMMPMPSTVNTHSGVDSGQGNSMLRHCNALHMMRPSQNLDPRQQIMAPELPMQASQGSSQAFPHFGGLTSSFSNQTFTSPALSYPLHHQQPHPMSQQQSHLHGNPQHPHLQGPNHASNTHKQAYAVHIAKEQCLQQQHLLQQHQQQQQFTSSNALMPQIQPESQLPISSPIQNSSQIQLQTSTAPASLLPLTPSSSTNPMIQHQQNHQMPPSGFGRNSQIGGNGLHNQMARQRHQLQQHVQHGGRHHPQQGQQHSESHQQAKLLKGVGRGNMMRRQNLHMDPSLLNGLPATTGSQTAEKSEQVMHLTQSQGLYSGSGLNSVPQSKPPGPLYSSNQTQPQPHQKIYSGEAPSPSMQLQQMPFHSYNCNPGHVSSVSSGCMEQAVPPVARASSNLQQKQMQMQPQPQPQHKLANQSQPTVQRVVQQNHQMNSDLPSRPQTTDAQIDQQSLNNSSQSSTITTPQPCIDATNVIPAVSSSCASQWKESEPLHNSTTRKPVMQLGSVQTLSTNSAGVEAKPIGHGRRQ